MLQWLCNQSESQHSGSQLRALQDQQDQRNVVGNYGTLLSVPERPLATEVHHSSKLQLLEHYLYQTLQAGKVKQAAISQVHTGYDMLKAPYSNQKQVRTVQVYNFQAL